MTPARKGSVYTVCGGKKGYEQSFDALDIDVFRLDGGMYWR